MIKYIHKKQNQDSTPYDLNNVGLKNYLENNKFFNHKKQKQDSTPYDLNNVVFKKYK